MLWSSVCEQGILVHENRRRRNHIKEAIFIRISAVPNEKITWGKLDADTPKFIVESDATIVAPLIFSWILGK